jgi:hypothetical protein
MDLSLLERNIKKRMYGSTEAFVADTKWILHNCIIFNTCKLGIFLSYFNGYDFLEVAHKYFENRLFYIMLAISIVTRLWTGQQGNQALILGKG